MDDKMKKEGMSSLMAAVFDSDPDVAMRAMAGGINDIIGKDHGFVLIVKPFGVTTGPDSHYISNCDRETIVQLLREKADILEQGLPGNEN